MVKKERKMTKKKLESFTLASAFEMIYEKSCESKLSPEFYDTCNDTISFVSKELNVTPFQSIMLAILANSEGSTSLNDMSSYTKCSPIRFRIHKEELDDLHYRHFVQWSMVRCSLEYRIRDEFMEAIIDNVPYTPKKYEDYTTYDVYTKIAKWIEMLKRDEGLYEDIVKNVRRLLESTRHLTFSKDLLTSEMNNLAVMVVLLTVMDKIEHNSDYISSSEILRVLPEESGIKSFIFVLNANTCILIKKGWMENYTVNGMVEPDKFCLTDKILETTLVELKEYIGRKDETISNLLLMPDVIVEKHMYYNERELEEIERLTRLLSIDRFKDIQQRLKEANMRTGFTCLFYGSPGTGKTETVLQLSRKTGRPIFQVNISELKSKWVGESEKKIQGLFCKYEAIVKKYDICPILFFNEADAIINKRSNNTDAAVDKMENACQNIILQAMENLSGIMIATTNLTNNLDSAFERRFLYKICFDKPTVDTRKQIWNVMLPSLSCEEAKSLAESYDFSGGQIENIARKQIVDSILYGHHHDISSVRSYCDNEIIRNSRTNKIGFIY
ncbi:MAG: AAA family ATPase [Bacteroidaceae bacterium]|nr:AAA family ATPase [Bacteroidaceae bacterium]